MSRANSIAELGERCERVRAWCWRCARGQEWFPGQLPERYWALPLQVAAKRFKCRRCKSSDQVQLLPSRIEIPNEQNPQTAAGAVHRLWADLKARRRREASGDHFSVPPTRSEILAANVAASVIWSARQRAAKDHRAAFRVV